MDIFLKFIFLFLIIRVINKLKEMSEPRRLPYLQNRMKQQAPKDAQIE
jgi:hypothetical protein